MNDDDLKSLYKDSSTEQPSANIDAKILAEAEQELQPQDTASKPRRTGWRPIFATAASVTLVVALAFQLIPLQQQMMEPLPEAVNQPETVSENETGTAASSDTMITVQANRTAAPKQTAAETMSTFQEAPAKAEEELGEAFDIRGFHDTVLDGGSLPLTILERRVDNWIASVKAEA